MREKTAIVVGLCVTILGVWAVGLYASGSGSENKGRRTRTPTTSRPAPYSLTPMPIPQEPGQTTRLQIDVFELICTSEQLAAFNLDTIVADDASPSVILDRLGKVGTARLLVRMDDTVNLLQRSRMTHGKQMPVIRDIVVSRGGTVTPSVNYQDVGFIADINGRWRENDSQWADIFCKLELSSIIQSSSEISSGVKLPSIVQFKVEKIMAIHNGKPTFTMSNGLPLPDDEQGTVNVALIRLQATRLAE